MSQMIPYANKKSSPQRMTRKRARNDVFMKNKKATKRAKAVRLELRLEREAASASRDGLEPLD